MLSCRMILGFQLSALLTFPAAATVIPLEDLTDATLEVGTDLIVSWDEAPLDTPMVIRLVDESGTKVAEVSGASDEVGFLEPTNVWSRSGIVGCDPSSDPDPESYRFGSFAEAEAVLLPRVLGIEVVEAESGITLLYHPLQFAPNLQECFHFSDAAGCPKRIFEQDEKIYLTGRNLAPGPNLLGFFMVCPTAAMEVGQTLGDMRQDYEDSLQRIPLAGQSAGPGGVVFTTVVGADGSNPRPGLYRGVVRRGNDQETVLQPEDQWVELDLCGDFAGSAISVNTVVRTSDKTDIGPDCPEAHP